MKLTLELVVVKKKEKYGLFIYPNWLQNTEQNQLICKDRSKGKIRDFIKSQNFLS